MSILPLLLVAAALPAQTVRLTNGSGYGDWAVDGWHAETLATLAVVGLDANE